jgi:hypothetical protein
MEETNDEVSIGIFANKQVSFLVECAKNLSPNEFILLEIFNSKKLDFLTLSCDLQLLFGHSISRVCECDKEPWQVFHLYDQDHQITYISISIQRIRVWVMMRMWAVYNASSTQHPHASFFKGLVWLGKSSLLWYVYIVLILKSRLTAEKMWFVSALLFE